MARYINTVKLGYEHGTQTYRILNYQQTTSLTDHGSEQILEAGDARKKTNFGLYD